MRTRRGHMGMHLVEALLFLVCIAGIIGFFCIRRCILDIPFLILWGVVLLVFGLLLIRGERRLHREEELTDYLSADDIKDGE